MRDLEGYILGFCIGLLIVIAVLMCKINNLSKQVDSLQQQLTETRWGVQEIYHLYAREVQENE